MFAFGCEKPASSMNSYSCESVVCQGPKSIIFAWGRNAPALELPEDVAYKVGPKTSYKYIVVNIHYLKKVSNDRSGLAITVGDKPRRYQAGIMLLLSGSIAIPPKTQKYTARFSCKYTGRTLRVFAYRVHAHMLGDVNSAYRVRDNEWVQLARGDPQWPQAFYPTDAIYDIKDGDPIVGMCSYHNDENRYVYAGPTHNDEMCNVYLMYYTDNADDVMEVCGANTYPQLESVIPAQAEQKPAPPASMNDKQTDQSNPMSHHDMDGSKIHSSKQQTNGNNNQENSNKKGGFLNNLNNQKSLEYLLAQAGLTSDDYYDEVENSRSKNRQVDTGSSNSRLNLDLGSDSGSSDDLIDPSSLLDFESGLSNDDYDQTLQDSSAYIRAKLAKLKKKTYLNSNGIEKLSKVNNLLNSKTVTSKNIQK
jgi:hypothetical protein